MKYSWKGRKTQIKKKTRLYVKYSWEMFNGKLLRRHKYIYKLLQKLQKKKKKKKKLAARRLFLYTPALHDDASAISVLK